MRQSTLLGLAALSASVFASPIERRQGVLVGESGTFQTMVNGKLETVNWSTRFDNGNGAEPTPAAVPSNVGGGSPFGSSPSQTPSFPASGVPQISSSPVAGFGNGGPGNGGDNPMTLKPSPTFNQQGSGPSSAPASGPASANGSGLPQVSSSPAGGFGGSGPGNGGNNPLTLKPSPTADVSNGASGPTSAPAGGFSLPAASHSSAPAGGKPSSSPSVAPVAPSHSTAAPAAASSAPASGAAGSYQQTAVDLHNKYRAMHSAPPVTWDTRLASAAQQIAATCNFAHSMNVDGGNYGQNIAGGSGSQTDVAGLTSAITMWYNENTAYANQYGLANPSGGSDTGHFTQLVWKSTTTIGCATQACSTASMGWFVVCNYGPPGNFGGQYAQNVLPATS